MAKQETTCGGKNSAEAEFRSLANGICEGIWIQRLLLKLEGHRVVKPKCDNKIAISIAKNPVHHDRTKYVENDRHFISEKLEKETLKLC